MNDSQTTPETRSQDATAALPGALRFPFELVKDDLAEVDAFISAQSRAFDPGVEGYVNYVCQIGGKRIRPALSLLAGGAVGMAGKPQREIGAVVELVHLATLIHDDIMDGADLRREMPTACSKWGPTLSVLLGDSLFARALELAASFGDPQVCAAVARAASAVCQGEILQTQRRFDLNLSRADYFRIIEMKTGALFAVACELGARLAGAADADQAALRDFGMKVGTAYQIYDDCLDLVGHEEVVGKTLGTDLARGKLTLPVLNLVASATPAQREKLNRRLLENEPIDVSALAGIADYEGAIERAATTARDLLTEARELLDPLPDTPHRAGLEQVTRYLDALLDACVA